MYLSPNKYNSIQNNTGFSLVELIIVIAIMAVLLSVLAPQYTKYVERSRVQADVNALESLKSAIEIVCIDPANMVFSDNDMLTLTVPANGGVTSIVYSNDSTDIKDDIESIMGSNYIDFTSSTAKGKIYIVTLHVTGSNNFINATGNWNSDGTLA